jgi:3-keto-L-gulonate-6-phosphate decarboxylase
LIAAGASIFVVGNAIFGQDDPTVATRVIRDAALAAVAR